MTVVAAAMLSLAISAVLINSSNGAPLNADLTFRPTPTSYMTERGVSVLLYAWLGEKVAVLSVRADLEPAVMRNIVRAIDAAYSYYEVSTGDKPRLDKNYRGLDTVAEVTDLCGAGCSNVGSTGIEISNQFFKILYDGVRQSNTYDQVVFYELGRNFWFYETKLGYQSPDHGDCISTGFAVLMRYLSLSAIGRKGSNYGQNYDTMYRETLAIVDKYAADPSLNWHNTLAIGESPVFGCTDLFASFLLRLRRDYGGNGFIYRLWRQAAQRPTAVTTPDAVDNLVLAACAAAHMNLLSLFEEKWKWPISIAAKAEAAKRWPQS